MPVVCPEKIDNYADTKEESASVADEVSIRQSELNLVKIAVS